MDKLIKCLDDLETRIDSDEETRLYNSWVDFIEGEHPDSLFLPKRQNIYPSKYNWPEVTINSAIEDYEKMASSQFSMCSDILNEGSGAIMCVRSNYGTGILASLFGAEIYMMEESTNVLPTVRPIDSLDKIKAIVDRGVPDLSTSLGGKVFEMGEMFVQLMSNYPRIAKFIHLYHPDVQGPVDTCELLCGSSLFTYVYDYPELVHSLLDLITETYIQFMRKWHDIVPPSRKNSVHWSFLHQGEIMLRDDSAMNLSPAMVDEFVLPYDQRILHEFNGGAIHFCGKGDHYIKHMSQMEKVYCIHMSQPEYNDVEVILSNTVDKGIKLLELPYDLAESLMKEGRQLHDNVHCKPVSN